MHITLIDKLWYTKHPLRWLLYPLSMIYQLIVASRRFVLEHFCQEKYDIPIIVVGNITVGGVGKTPLVIALAEQLQSKGLHVGIVSRGYGAQCSIFPHEVSMDDEATQVGDEPLLIAQKTHCPVVIAPKRTQAIRYLLKHHSPQVILSDDGLQHYAMGRAIEIAVIDGPRGMGNGLCLPAGPLRERATRLKKADFIVVNGDGILENAYQMNLIPTQCVHLKSEQPTSLDALSVPVAAVAGIGNPGRFFDLLGKLGVSFRAYPFSDHHAFQKKDLCFKEKMIIMTEKDAVKCRSFATDSMYYLPVNAKLSDAFWHAFFTHQQLQGLV